jgi:hypothetical protein
MPALPYSKKRYYLSGIDWIIGALNSYMHSTTSVGNHSTLVLELAESLNELKLRERLDLIFTLYPMLSGKIVRDLVNLAPYFKPSGGNKQKYDLRIVKLSKEDEYSAECRRVLNSPFSGDTVYFAFTLISCGTRRVLMMTFDHRILDARGAELFLELLSGNDEKKLRSSQDNIKVTDAPQLMEWSDKFASGRTVQRKIIELTKGGCYTPSKYIMGDFSKSSEDNLLPDFYHFSERETCGIHDKSEEMAGYMMETPYLLAVTSLAIYRVSESDEPLKYFVPVPIDMRKKGEEARRTFCNHLSFLFFYFDISKNTTLESLTCEIRRQFFMQIADEFPENMVKAAYPGRIFPLWLLKRFMRFPFSGKMSSFVFANVGVTSFSSGDIVGTDVKSLHHMPRIPTPPGIGIFFNTYKKQLNLTVTSDRGALRYGFGERVKDQIVSTLLLGCNCPSA